MGHAVILVLYILAGTLFGLISVIIIYFSSGAAGKFFVTTGFIIQLTIDLLYLLYCPLVYVHCDGLNVVRGPR